MIWNVIVTCYPWKIENSWANSLRGTSPEETLPGAGDQIGSQRLQRAVPPKPQSQCTPLFSGRVWLKGFFMCCLLALVSCREAREHTCSHALPRGNGLRPSMSVCVDHRTACSTLRYVAWFNPLWTCYSSQLFGAVSNAAMLTVQQAAPALTGVPHDQSSHLIPLCNIRP